jgi:hypothetical protein
MAGSIYGVALEEGKSAKGVSGKEGVFEGDPLARIHPQPGTEGKVVTELPGGQPLVHFFLAARAGVDDPPGGKAEG